MEQLDGEDTEPAGAFFSWRVVLADGLRLTVAYSPEATADRVRRDYPGATVEPIPERRQHPPTEEEAAKLRALLAAVYAGDSEADLAEALAAALADPADALDSYRAVTSARGIPINPTPKPAKSCRSCAHAARPGLRNLHCGAGRDDLPPAYGPGHPLRTTPADGGASCAHWEES